MQKFLIVTVTLFVAFVLVFGNQANAQTKKPWVVPDKYKTMKSTVKAGDAAAIASGKELWAKHCKSCHGGKGLGDGPKAASLKTSAGDFSSADFQKQSDDGQNGKWMETFHIIHGFLNLYFCFFHLVDLFIDRF